MIPPLGSLAIYRSDTGLTFERLAPFRREDLASYLGLDGLLRAPGPPGHCRAMHLRAEPDGDIGLDEWHGAGTWGAFVGEGGVPRSGHAGAPYGVILETRLQ
jgi:hypothetical protein